MAAVGMSGVSPTLSVTTGTSASTNTVRQKVPDQVMRLQQDLAELQPQGLATCVIQINITFNENLLGICYPHLLPPPCTDALLVPPEALWPPGSHFQ